MKEKILVLDFGSQYTQLIARRVREQKVYSEILPYNASIERIKEFAPKGIIFSGGPSSVYGKDAPMPDKEIFNLGIPILGICYGMQIMTYMLEGKVAKSVKARSSLRHHSCQPVLKSRPDNLRRATPPRPSDLCRVHPWKLWPVSPLPKLGHWPPAMTGEVTT